MSVDEVTKPISVSKEEVAQAIDQGRLGLSVILDGKWEPAKDIPAAWKIVQAASISLAALAYFIHEAAQLLG